MQHHGDVYTDSPKVQSQLLTAIARWAREWLYYPTVYMVSYNRCDLRNCR